MLVVILIKNTNNTFKIIKRIQKVIVIKNNIYKMRIILIIIYRNNKIEILKH